MVTLNLFTNQWAGQLDYRKAGSCKEVPNKGIVMFCCYAKLSPTAVVVTCHAHVVCYCYSPVYTYFKLD